ncbi:MAG: response regulator [Pirellulales bacterium]|nr:response regulator [Pirellulales bacterium]
MTATIRPSWKPGTRSQRQPIPSRNGRQILLVDHDPRALESLSASLSRQGFTVATAGDGAAAMRMASCQPTQLIVLDANLPDADGLSVCEHLTDDSSTNEIPVIVLSSESDPSIVRRARAAGCTYFLRKPFDPNVLLVLIENSLRLRKVNWLAQ